MIGIFAIYPSPLTLRANPAAGYAQVAGQDWVLKQGSPSVKTVGLGAAFLYRFASALWGGSQKTDYPHEDRDEHVPDHFNYSHCETLCESFEGDRYMRSREKFIELLYTELYPQIGRFTKYDFAKLERDSSVDKLYNNGDVQVWYVHGQTPTKQQGSK